MVAIPFSKGSSQPRDWTRVSSTHLLAFIYLLVLFEFHSVSSVAQSCPTLCDPMDCSMPGFPVRHQLLELTQTHIHRVSDAIQPSHPLSLFEYLPVYHTTPLGTTRGGGLTKFHCD